MEKALIVVAGATGNLGERIVRALVARDTQVKALVRRGSEPEKIRKLEALGATVAEVDFTDATSLASACQGASCVVSALSGLHDVIVEAQTALLEAAIVAGVPRFIPSDFSIDFMEIPAGSNRNLDLRREFHGRLEKAPIAATSVLCGAFMDLLTGQAPIILFKLRRVLYWQNAYQRMDFTTMDDAAAFTAYVALDASTPRTLRIAGDQVNARQLAVTMTKIRGKKFIPIRAGKPGHTPYNHQIDAPIIPRTRGPLSTLAGDAIPRQHVRWAREISSVGQ